MRRVDLEKAARVQQLLAAKLILDWGGREVKRVAGADFAYDSQQKMIRAAVVVLELPEFEILEASLETQEIQFPYVPGFLAFREGPVFLKAFRRLKNRPDVTLIDGNGIAHPRKMGLASFVGVVLDICTVGCAKTAFYPFDTPPHQRGEFTYFVNDNQERVGLSLRTRSNVRPIFVSPGHRVGFAQAREIVLRSSRFRIPEPLRQAHRLATHPEWKSA